MKKRLKQYQTKTKTKSKSKIKSESSDNSIITNQSESGNSSSGNNTISETPGQMKPPMSPQPSSSEVSSVITDAITAKTENMDIIKAENMDPWEYFPEIDESFWSDSMSSDNSSAVPLSSFEGASDYHHQFQSQQEVLSASTTSMFDAMDQPDYGYGQTLDDAMDFWYDLFIKAGGEQELMMSEF